MYAGWVSERLEAQQMRLNTSGEQLVLALNASWYPSSCSIPQGARQGQTAASDCVKPAQALSHSCAEASGWRQQASALPAAICQSSPELTLIYPSLNLKAVIIPRASRGKMYSSSAQTRPAAGNFLPGPGSLCLAPEEGWQEHLGWGNS